MAANATFTDRTASDYDPVGLRQTLPRTGDKNEAKLTGGRCRSATKQRRTHAAGES